MSEGKLIGRLKIFTEIALIPVFSVLLWSVEDTAKYFNILDVLFSVDQHEVFYYIELVILLALFLAYLWHVYLKGTYLSFVNTFIVPLIVVYIAQIILYEIIMISSGQGISMLIGFGFVYFLVFFSYIMLFTYMALCALRIDKNKNPV